MMQIGRGARGCESMGARRRFAWPDEAGPTEGGEALPLLASVSAESSPESALAGSPPPWHVVWTRSHCEQAVHDQLAVRGFHPFLPKVRRWSRRAGLRHLISTP